LVGRGGGKAGRFGLAHCLGGASPMLHQPRRAQHSIHGGFGGDIAAFIRQNRHDLARRHAIKAWAVAQRQHRLSLWDAELVGGTG